MNILKYDRWIFTTIHKRLLEKYNRNIPTRTLRYVVSSMIFDGFLNEDCLKLASPDNCIVDEMVCEINSFLDSDAYRDYETTIKVTYGTRDKLNSLKASGESYEDVIQRLLSS